MKNYYKYKKIITGLTILTTGTPVITFAAENVFEVQNPLGVKTVTELLSKIGGYFYGLSAAVATIMILYGAFQILTAGSNASQVTAGKNTIFYAALGLAIVFFAGGLKSLIVSILGG